jgi:hypothetical protein
MAVANGFGKVVMNGSVFMYDTGDTVNSYIGEPTINYWDGVQYSVYNEGATNSRNQSWPLPPISGYEVVKVTANTPGVYGQSILWKAPYPNNNVATITNSIYAWLESGTYVQVGQHWFPWYYGTQKAIPTGQWVRISETYAINEGNSYGVAALTYSTNGVAYFTMPQYEYKSHVTPFIGASQTRSATQGLLPLVGNSTINLSTVSFDSNAQMTFDGTDDKIDVSYYSQVNNSLSRSWEVIVRPTANLSYAGIFGNKLGYGCSFYCNGGIYLWDGNWVFNWYDNSSYQFLYSYSPPSVNSYTHIVGTYDATDQKPRIYVNGELKATYGSSTNMNYGGETYVIDIGWNSKDGGLHYFQGQIPITKYYQGKALSAAEVKQNYNKYKTRFNLS